MCWQTTFKHEACPHEEKVVFHPCQNYEMSPAYCNRPLPRTFFYTPMETCEICAPDDILETLQRDRPVTWDGIPNFPFGEDATCSIHDIPADIDSNGDGEIERVRWKQIRVIARLQEAEDTVSGNTSGRKRSAQKRKRSLSPFLKTGKAANDAELTIQNSGYRMVRAAKQKFEWEVQGEIIDSELEMSAMKFSEGDPESRVEEDCEQSNWANGLRTRPMPQKLLEAMLLAEKEDFETKEGKVADRGRTRSRNRHTDVSEGDSGLLEKERTSDELSTRRRRKKSTASEDKTEFASAQEVLLAEEMGADAANSVLWKRVLAKKIGVAQAGAPQQTPEAIPPKPTHSRSGRLLKPRKLL